MFILLDKPHFDEDLPEFSSDFEEWMQMTGTWLHTHGIYVQLFELDILPRVAIILESSLSFVFFLLLNFFFLLLEHLRSKLHLELLKLGTELFAFWNLEAVHVLFTDKLSLL